MGSISPYKMAVGFLFNPRSIEKNYDNCEGFQEEAPGCEGLHLPLKLFQGH